MIKTGKRGLFGKVLTFSRDYCYLPYSKCCTAKAHAPVEVWTGSHFAFE